MYTIYLTEKCWLLTLHFHMHKMFSEIIILCCEKTDEWNIIMAFTVGPKPQFYVTWVNHGRNHSLLPTLISIICYIMLLFSASTCTCILTKWLKNNTPHDKVILPLLLHCKWASNFRHCVHLKLQCTCRTPIPCPVERLLRSWWYCPFKLTMLPSIPNDLKYIVIFETLN